MPADVVRYHGLDKMMELRDEAKAGLARMEAMGQMGNADEATIPEGVPFNIEDLDIDDDNPLQMQVGGFVPTAPTFTPGGVQQSQLRNTNHNLLWHRHLYLLHTRRRNSSLLLFKQ